MPYSCFIFARFKIADHNQPAAVNKINIFTKLLVAKSGE